MAPWVCADSFDSVITVSYMKYLRFKMACTVLNAFLAQTMVGNCNDIVYLSVIYWSTGRAVVNYPGYL